MQLPEQIQEVMRVAVKEAARSRAEAVEPLHLFVALCTLGPPQVTDAMRAHKLKPRRLRRRMRALARKVTRKTKGGPKRISGRVIRLLDHARRRAEEAHQSLDAGFVLLALLEEPDIGLDRAFRMEKLPVDQLRQYLQPEMPQPDILDQGPAKPVEPLPRIKHPPTPTLDRYGKDYTALARGAKISPVIGRNDEIKQVVRILLRKEKNNPVLVGEPGVGKTSIVEGLALRVVADGAPEQIRNLRIVEVMISSLVAGTKLRGEFEERLQRVIDEGKSDQQLVIFLDEIHTLVRAGSGGGAMDAANILKPALVREGIRCIGATTRGEYRKYIESDPALERRFQPVVIEEPTPSQTREILSGLRSTYEAHHGVEITNEAIEAAVELSIKCLPDRRLPDKARDLIDQAASTKRFLTFSPGVPQETSPQRVMREDVARVVSEWTGIPVQQLTADQRQRLVQMEEALRQRVIGQDHAVSAVSQVVRTALAGLSRPEHPYGVFLFMGPTGVGKTELAKALAEFLWNNERCMVRFDMSEYMEEHSINKLIGAPPGYVGYDEGGQLTAAVRRLPYCVLLFDEIEKAHPKVSDLFLQIFDDGRLTDAQGRLADFRNTIIILTTNLNVGVASVNEKRPPLGFRWDRDDATTPITAFPPAVDEPSQNELRKALTAHFRPELINRISQIVQFRTLGGVEVRAIIDKIIGRVQNRLTDKNISLRVSPPAYDALMNVGFKPEWGAREMERVIEQQIVQPLAQALVDGRFKPGDAVRVIPGDHGVTLRRNEPP